MNVWGALQRWAISFVFITAIGVFLLSLPLGEGNATLGILLLSRVARVRKLAGGSGSGGTFLGILLDYLSSSRPGGVGPPSGGECALCFLALGGRVRGFPFNARHSHSARAHTLPHILTHTHLHDFLHAFFAVTGDVATAGYRESELQYLSRPPIFDSALNASDIVCLLLSYLSLIGWCFLLIFFESAAKLAASCYLHTRTQCILLFTSLRLLHLQILWRRGGRGGGALSCLRRSASCCAASCGGLTSERMNAGERTSALLGIPEPVSNYHFLRKAWSLGAPILSPAAPPPQ